MRRKARLSSVIGGSYQMDPANADEALREVELDSCRRRPTLSWCETGLPYLDILWRVRERFGRPTAVYHVSGEFAMVKAAAAKGLIEERAAVLEIMTSLKRAGADFIVNYWALDLMEWLKRLKSIVAAAVPGGSHPRANLPTAAEHSGSYTEPARCPTRKRGERPPLISP